MELWEKMLKKNVEQKVRPVDTWTYFRFREHARNHWINVTLGINKRPLVRPDPPDGFLRTFKSLILPIIEEIGSLSLPRQVLWRLLVVIKNLSIDRPITAVWRPRALLRNNHDDTWNYMICVEFCWKWRKHYRKVQGSLRRAARCPRRPIRGRMQIKRNQNNNFEPS